MKRLKQGLGTSRGGQSCAQELVCLPALNHPPDSKVMHEPTEQKCSGESASSHVKSIRRLIEAAQRFLLWGTASLFLATQSSMPAHQVAPGTEDPTLGSINAGSMHALSPSFNFGCSGIKCTSPRLLAKKRLRAIFLAGFSKLKRSKRARTHTKTHRNTYYYC